MVEEGSRWEREAPKGGGGRGRQAREAEGEEGTQGRQREREACIDMQKRELTLHFISYTSCSHSLSPSD